MATPGEREGRRVTLDADILSKLEQRAARFEEIERLVADPAVASDPKRFPDLLRERGQLERAHELFVEARQLAEDETEARSMIDSGDADMAELGREELERIAAREPDIDREIKGELVKDEDLARTRVIVEVRAGTGGDEATLFARDLFEIYTRYAESKRWKLEPIELSASDAGGFKEAIFALSGEDVWNRMRFESGGHRVQRVPATESQGRIHTSAATVAVLPEAEDVDVEIKDEDLRIDTMRAGGPGGQSVNTTSSAVRITHLPTGTVVQCQDEKSQHKNKAKALRVLRARLFDAEQQRLHAERADQRKSQVGSGDRSQRVRTYNWPQNRCTDHRLSDNHSLEGILAGKLDGLIAQLIEWDVAERIRAGSGRCRGVGRWRRYLGASGGSQRAPFGRLHRGGRFAAFGTEDTEGGLRPPERRALRARRRSRRLCDSQRRDESHRLPSAEPEGLRSSWSAKRSTSVSSVLKAAKRPPLCRRA